MLTAYDGKIYNNGDVWVDYIVQDIVSGEIFSILIDENSNIYAELSLEPLYTFDIIDELNGVFYGLFVYEGQVHSAPIRTPSGDLIHGNSCFISVGATVNLQVIRTNDTPTDPSDITLDVFDQSLSKFLALEFTVNEIQPNIFIVSFVIPIKGDFLAVVKLLDSNFIVRKFEVQNYSYQELVTELEKVIGTLNIGNAYI